MFFHTLKKQILQQTVKPTSYTDIMGCSYHKGLADRVGEQNQEHTQHRSDLDGEAARLALEPEERRWLVSRRSRSEDEAPVHLLPHSGEDTPLITER